MISTKQQTLGISSRPQIAPESTSLKQYFANRKEAILDPNLPHWDVSRVTSLEGTFQNCGYFNQDISNWDVGQVKNMGMCFAECDMFDGDLSTWNTGQVTSMFRTFYKKGTIESNIGTWDVSSVKNMGSIFEGCWIHDDLSNWDVSNVEDFGSAFKSAHIRFDLSRWNPKSAKSFACMFEDVFQMDQDLSRWCVESVVNFQNMFKGSELPRYRYDALLISWSRQNVQPNRVFGAGWSQYTPGGEAAAARTKLIEEKGWTIQDGGPYVPDPIPTVVRGLFGCAYGWFLDYQDDIIESREVIDTVDELIECLRIWYETGDPKKTFSGRLHKKAHSVKDLRAMVRYLVENAEFEEDEWAEFVAWSPLGFDQIERDMQKSKENSTERSEIVA